MTPAIEFDDVTRSFGAVVALAGVTFAIQSGEAHAIVGENGAGKSTLLKILAGDLTADRGHIRLADSPVTLSSPREALVRGIGLVPQETLAFPDLTVAANIFAGREMTGRFGRLREAEMRERSREILARLHLPVSPDAIAGSLPLAYRQLLQVARALAFDCRILALDEPTTALTASEADHLFRILDDLKKSGVTIVYVSHRLPEVFRLCDRITVLRDGRWVTTLERREASSERVVQAMVGRALEATASPRSLDAAGAPLLEVRSLGRRHCFEQVSFSVRRGEIVGLFGLVGSGRTEVLETVAGLARADAGTIELDGRPFHARSSRAAARAGIALVPEDRQRQGLFSAMNLRHNLVLPLAEVRGHLMVARRERALAATWLSRWRIKAASPAVLPGSLSGGNQQKVVVAKWLGVEPRVLLLDEPTKGVDVAAKFEIHEIVRAKAADGVACLVVSSDLPEILALAQRLIVMREGRIRGELRAGADEEQVMRLAATDSGEAA